MSTIRIIQDKAGDRIIRITFSYTVQHTERKQVLQSINFVQGDLTVSNLNIILNSNDNELLKYFNDSKIIMLTDNYIKSTVDFYFGKVVLANLKNK